MESILFRLFNYEECCRIAEEFEQLADPQEQAARAALLIRIRDAVAEYDVHVREYAWKQTIRRLLDRGIALVPADRSEVTAQWDACFDSMVTQEAKQTAEHYTDQFRWHLFSFELLDALQGERARTAFDCMEKDRLYLFFDYAEECYCVENAGLVTAEDIDTVKENSPLNYMDLYFFDPIRKWTYVKPHEEYCGPYFFGI